ncbi:hypothetical protein HGB07_01290 [Candidatus Roizmanbacteria bacterium]|nr:hypothetical protein [Candidatus Roizmanbacteria bacterium]
MATRQLTWKLEDKKMTCTFADGTMFVAEYKDIKEFEQNQGKGIVHELFQHGLKQKLSDCVAGATKNGVSFEKQKAAMEKVWKGICAGEMTVRKATVPQVKLSDIRAKLNAMPEGKEKTQAVAAAKMLGLME